MSARLDDPPVRVIHLFNPERKILLELLSSLNPEEWSQPTACPGWSVKDITAHLVHDDLRRLSVGRDGFSRPYTTDTFSELVAFVNEANELWVSANRPISPQVLQDLLRLTGTATLKYFQSLDLQALGGPVSWAGPNPALVWLDLAREYTERWVHQQQIRDATGRDGLRNRRFMAPVLATFAYALPHAYRQVAAPESTEIELIVSGPAGGSWRLVRGENAWHLRTGIATRPKASIRTDPDVMWRLLSRDIDAGMARSRSQVTGDVTLTQPFFSALAIIA